MKLEATLFILFVDIEEIETHWATMITPSRGRQVMKTMKTFLNELKFNKGIKCK